MNFASGEYIAIHHSDDLWKPTKLEKQVEFLEKNPDYAACFTQAIFIDESGESYELPTDHPYHHVFEYKNKTRTEWLNHLFWHMSSFCNPSSLVRNEKNFIKFDRRFFQLSDFKMWLNVCKQKNLYVLPEKLTKFRLRRTAQNSMSSLTVEKAIRNKNESYFTAREFLPFTKDAQEFLKIFPEAEKYQVNGEIVTKFAFAELCLQHAQPTYKNLGLEILYQLLQEKKSAEKIKKLYNYTEKNFIADTGKYDSFGANLELKKLHSELFLDFGEDFKAENVFQKTTLLNSDGKFFVAFDCELIAPITRFRFDPETRSGLAVKITKIVVNGEEIKNFSSNAILTVEDWNYFLTADPHFVIEKNISEKRLHAEFTGVVEFDKVTKIEQLFDNQQEQIRRLNTELSGIKNSASWKITKPLRDTKKFLKTKLN